MSEENESSQSELLKSIRDKLKELEDLQLVNKLDIINVKNELDKASLTGGPSPEIADRVSELAKLVEKSDTLKKAKKLGEELERLKSQMQEMKPADTGELKSGLDDITHELSAMKAKISGLERGKAGAPAPKKDDELEKLRERVGRLESAKPPGVDVEIPGKIRRDIKDIKEKLAGLGKRPRVPTTSKDVLEKISEIERLSSELESLRSALDEQKTVISGLGRKRPETPAAPPRGLAERIKKLEERISGLDAGKKARQAKGKGAGNVEEVRSMLESLRRSVDDQGKKLLDIQSDKAGAANLEKLDSISDEVKAIKSQVTGIEKKAASVGMAPDALEELRKMKGEFPAEEFHELKKRTAAIESNLDRIGKLAVGMKPIELPSSIDEGLKPTKEMEAKLKSLEKLVGDGVSDKRFRQLEEKMEDLREWLPEYIGSETKHKIDDVRKEVATKMREVDNLKEEMVQSTIEHLLAQPGTVSKLLGEKIKKQIDELQQRLEKIDHVVKPSDAKLTTVLRDLDEAKRELEKEKLVLHDTQTANKEEIEALGIELKALNTRLDSFQTSVKSVEGASVTGVMRDLEILKTKADWLESSLHKLDLNHIYEKINELEDRMKSSPDQQNGPVVIE